jgi:hypothetical protein
MRYYILTVTARQAEVLLHLTELAAALGTGRVRAMASAPLPVHDLATRDTLHRQLAALEPCVTGQGANSWLSISAPQVHDDSKIAHDLAQVIAHRLAWDRAPAGGAAVDFREPLPIGPEPLATMAQVSDDRTGPTQVTPDRRSLTEEELVVIRGALHEEISRARQVPAGTETGVYAHLVQAYQKVIAWLERLQPGRPEHGWHRACLTTAEQARAPQHSGPAAPTAPLPASVPHQRTRARVPDRHSLTVEVGRLRSALRYIYQTYCHQHPDQGTHVAWHALTVEIPAVIEAVLPGIARRAQECRTTAPAAHKGSPPQSDAF